MQESRTSVGKYLLEILKALIIAIVITLVLVLVAAFAVKTFNIKTKYIDIINQVIKCVAILVSALICLKQKGAGYLRGFVFGLAYIGLSFVVFSLFNGSFSGGIGLFNDFVLGGISGLISGIIAVNLRK